MDLFNIISNKFLNVQIMDAIEFIGIEEDLNANTLAQCQKLVEQTMEDENSDENSKDKSLDGKSPLKPFVVNMVACVDYGIPLNLFKIATSIRNAEYNPIRFPAVTIRIQDPKATGLTFKNGKVNIVGCKTEEHILQPVSSGDYSHLLGLNQC